MIDLDAVRQRYREFAESECRGYSELYYRLALHAADDDLVMRFVAARPVAQPNLFFAALQYVAGAAGMPSSVSQVKALLNARGTEIAQVMATRHTQTNEVGRCAVFLPALPSGPLALIEVGASAGLCLLLDRFLYDYGSARIGAASSPVSLRCTLTNPAPLPSSPPEVVWRRGLDIAPIDVHSAEAVGWLLACVWADHSFRRQRVEAAIALSRTDPPAVVRGDLVDDLASLVAQAPANARLVVFHSAVLAYLNLDRRRAFSQVLADLSRAREIIWISNEAPGVVSSLPASHSSEARMRFLVGRKTLRGKVEEDELLALVHPHGCEMTWLAGAG